MTQRFTVMLNRVADFPRLPKIYYILVQIINRYEFREIMKAEEYPTRYGYETEAEALDALRAYETARENLAYD